MTRALLVIDVQQEYFKGALPISYPAGHLHAILQVMDNAAKAGVPTAVIRHHQADSESPIFRLNSEMWQLHPEVAERPRSILIEKQLPGSFTGTGLEAWLRQVGADTVSIAGYMTHMCCDTTARQAFHLGYKVERQRSTFHRRIFRVPQSQAEVTATRLNPHQKTKVGLQRTRAFPTAQS